MKIIIDYSGDGLQLTPEAVNLLNQRSTSDAGSVDHLLDYCTLTQHSEANIPYYPRSLRHHPELLELVSHLGSRTFCKEGDVRLVEIPDDVDWKIIDFAGFEWIYVRTANGTAMNLELQYKRL
jgi:hypothetical protein